MKALRAWIGFACLVHGYGCADATVVVGRLPGVVVDSGASPSTGGVAAPEGMPASPVTDAGMPKSSAQAAMPRMRNPVIEQGGKDAFCTGRGGAVRSEDACAPIEHDLFRYGVCTCGDAHLVGSSFLLDAFDSSRGWYGPGEGGAAMGVNGDLYPLADDIQVRGSLNVSGSQALSIAGTNFSVQGDFKSSAPLDVTSRGVNVGRDLWQAADVRGPGPDSIGVGRVAYLPPSIGGADTVRGQVTTRDFLLPPACACGAASRLDVQGIVASARSVADNAAAGFRDDALSGLTQANTWTIPCGRLVLKELTSKGGTLNFQFDGRTALFVEGDVDLSGTTVFALGDNAEVDLFVAGNLRLQGTAAFGTPLSRPSAFRIYVAGQIETPSVLLLYALLYAPNAHFTLNAMSGALFLNSLTAQSAAQLHYDRAVLAQPSGCARAAEVCRSTADCADRLACVSSRCGACTDDAECAAPQVCASGRCAQLLAP